MHTGVVHIEVECNCVVEREFPDSRVLTTGKILGSDDCRNVGVNEGLPVGNDDINNELLKD